MKTFITPHGHTANDLRQGERRSFAPHRADQIDQDRRTENRRISPAIGEFAIKELTVLRARYERVARIAQVLLDYDEISSAEFDRRYPELSNLSYASFNGHAGAFIEGLTNMARKALGE